MDPQKTTPPATPTPPDAKLHFLDYWRIIRIRKTVILAVFLLVVVTTVVVTLILPRAYCSIARIKVSKDRAVISPIFDSQTDLGYDPYFIQTEFEVIKSQVVLDRVIENLHLNTEWGKRFGGGETLKTSETRTLLEHYLDLRPARNTSIIEIRFYSEDKDEAARVANEVASVYQDYRVALRNNQTLQGIKALQQEYDARMDKIRKAQEEVDQLRIKLGINEADAAGDAPSPVIEAVNLQRLEGQRIDASVTYAKELEQLNNLKGKTREELKNTIPTVVTDRQIEELLTELSQAETKLTGLRKDYGPENPEVIKTSAIVDNLNEQVNARVDGTLMGLQSRVDADKAALDQLTSAVENARKMDVEKTARSRPFYDAKQNLQELQTFAKALNLKIASTTVELDLPKTSIVEITDRADASILKPVKPNRPLNIALGIIFGLIVGVGLAFFIEYLDTSVKTIDDVERALQAPVLGVIPQNVGRLIDEGAESPHAEAYRVLRTNLLFSRKSDQLNTIAIVSAGAGEGKSTTIFNLATVFAQNGQRVVVVDSDLRRPSLHKFLRVTNSIGLTNYLLKQNTLEEVIQTTNVPTLDFMASGKLPSSSMGILSSAAMKNLITELKARYDFVFFDSPPIMGVSDASILASEVDMTLQVIQYRRYPQPMNIRAKQLIEKVGGNLMGIVLNNINMSQDESYYYYSGYYHEYYSKHEDEEAHTGTDTPGAKAKLDIKQKY
jgi:polysaccharide biosynthesis transport protein